ncbi:MAG: branched-chain amino acid ABC transporter permease [Rhodoferax sp.]|nr:branched-chain amino acid ABC transporter permease [Rhodoferax sp.]
MELFTVSLLNGISYGLLLFMLSAGLTLIFSMMGVLNFAHTSFYMLGAYLGYSLGNRFGFWLALVLAPLAVGLLGAAFERLALRRVHRHGHVAELLFTFGLSFVVLELVQLVWGRSSVDYRVPQLLEGPIATVFGIAFPAYRAFMMLVSLAMLAALAWLLARTRTGLLIRAALTHPHMVQALGHDLPKIHMGVFGGGCALAGLAGVIGGNTYVTEPGMALSVGALVFVVVVVGGIGSLAGAFVASLLIGVVQTLAVGLDVSLLSLLNALGLASALAADTGGVWALKLSQLAPVLPYLMMVLMLMLRPRGLFGPREG